jgi:hypothetical protein
MNHPDKQNQTPDALSATEVAPAEWVPPHIDKLIIKDTAAASPNDTADAGIFS